MDYSLSILFVFFREDICNGKREEYVFAFVFSAYLHKNPSGVNRNNRYKTQKRLLRNYNAGPVLCKYRYSTTNECSLLNWYASRDKRVVCIVQRVAVQHVWYAPTVLRNAGTLFIKLPGILVVKL